MASKRSAQNHECILQDIVLNVDDRACYTCAAGAANVVVLRWCNLQGIEFLSYANTSPPYPGEWVSTYSLLMDGLRIAVSRPHPPQILPRRPGADLSEVPPSNLDTLGHAHAPEACIRGHKQWAMEHSDMAWYARTLGRFHVNSFRYEAYGLSPVAAPHAAAGLATS